MDPTELNREYLTVRWPEPLGHPAPLTNYRQMPAPYIIVDVIETNATYYMGFFWRQDVRTGN